MNKEEKINTFDPNGIADVNNNLFGLPFSCDEADVVIIPVPWEVTVSYSSGTANGPKAILDASYQVDLYDPQIKDAWKSGIAMEDISETIANKNKLLRQKAEQYLDLLEKGNTSGKEGVMQELRDQINKECKELVQWVKERSLNYLNKNKVVGLLGGDHSTPLGLMYALAEKYDSFAILQVDAHADLRESYEGFEFSHASIMYNALKIPQVSKLVQVGIRDYCESEADLIESNEKIHTFFDRDIKHMQYEGTSWEMICKEIIKELPEFVYLSFDIDGLDPKLCPNTGTPVPGGFEFEQAAYLIQKLVESGRRIIAFDLNEVSPGTDSEWDANVGARLLYRMSNLAAVSSGKLKFPYLNKELSSS